MADKIASRPDHLEDLEKTHTNIDVVHVTQKLPYREVNFIGTYVAILLACDACFAGFIMPITSLQLIEEDLGVSPNAVWISLGWILLSAISFVLLGRLSDIFGRRWFFTGCTVSALIGSIIGATAQKTDVLIAASVFLGLASSGQLSFNYSLGELVPIRHRFAANGFIFLSTVRSSPDSHLDRERTE
jgi:MFS family permease